MGDNPIGMVRTDTAADVRFFSHQIRELMEDVVRLGGYRVADDGTVTTRDGSVVALAHAYEVTLARANDACTPPSTQPQS